MKALSTILLALLCFPAAAAHANGLIQKLPKDGSWVRYHMTIREELPEANERTVMMTVRSVGETLEGGEKCRWIEMEIQGTDEDGQSDDYLLKGLILEKELQPDSTPTSGVLRGWQRHGPHLRTVTRLDDLQKPELAVMAILLPGSRKDAKQFDEKKGVTYQVEYQQGRLDCKSGLTGSMELNDGPALLDMSVYTVWLHEKVPFGVAAATYEMTARRGGKIWQMGTVTFTVEDFGTDAKSALPDKK